MLQSTRFDAATDELHTYLSSRLHTSSKSAMVVRRLLPDSNEITVDLSAHRTAEIDRFVLSCLPEAPGTITATAGTLNRPRHTRTFASHRDVLAWMRATSTSNGAL